MSDQRELIRRLYVELLWCDRQLVDKGAKQGSTVRDVLAESLEWLRANPKDATAAPVVVGEDMALVSRKETIELLAEAIYDQWKDEPNYVPWRKGGNSDKQYAARDIARTVLSLAALTAALGGGD